MKFYGYSGPLKRKKHIKPILEITDKKMIMPQPLLHIAAYIIFYNKSMVTSFYLSFLLVSPLNIMVLPF